MRAQLNCHKKSTQYDASTQLPASLLGAPAKLIQLKLILNPPTLVWPPGKCAPGLAVCQQSPKPNYAAAANSLPGDTSLSHSWILPPSPYSSSRIGERIHLGTAPGPGDRLSLLPCLGTVNPLKNVVLVLAVLLVDQLRLFNTCNGFIFNNKCFKCEINSDIQLKMRAE